MIVASPASILTVFCLIVLLLFFKQICKFLYVNVENIFCLVLVTAPIWFTAIMIYACGDSCNYNFKCSEWNSIHDELKKCDIEGRELILKKLESQKMPPLLVSEFQHLKQMTSQPLADQYLGNFVSLDLTLSRSTSTQPQ